jgi:hypothetical protein
MEGSDPLWGICVLYNYYFDFLLMYKSLQFSQHSSFHFLSSRPFAGNANGPRSPCIKTPPHPRKAPGLSLSGTASWIKGTPR